MHHNWPVLTLTLNGRWPWLDVTYLCTVELRCTFWIIANLVIYISYLRSKSFLAFVNSYGDCLVNCPYIPFSEIADTSPFWYAKVQQKVTHCAILGESGIALTPNLLTSLASHWLIFVPLQYASPMQRDEATFCFEVRVVYTRFICWAFSVFVMM